MRKTTITLIALLALVLSVMAFHNTTLSTTNTKGADYLLYYFEYSTSSTKVIIFEKLAYAYFPDRGVGSSGTYLAIKTIVSDKMTYIQRFMRVDGTWYWSSPDLRYTISGKTLFLSLNGSSWIISLMKGEDGRMMGTSTSTLYVIVTMKPSISPSVTNPLH